MKPFYLTLMFFLFALQMPSQVGIGTLNPDASAALDVKSTTSVVLAPRMTEIQRLAIASPATGLLVYEIDTTPGFWYFDGSIWITLGADKDWTINGNDIHNANTGNVGIGINTPTSLVHIENPSIAVSTYLSEDFEDNAISAPITTGGDSPFVTTTGSNEFYTGTIGVKSGDVDDGENSFLEASVNIPSAAGASLTFAYRTSIEMCCDRLTVYIDGANQTPAGLSSINWTTASFNIPTGAHTFKIEYQKEFFFSELNDEIYIDDIKVIENGVSKTFRLVDGNQADGNILVSDADGYATWRPAKANSDDDWRFISGNTHEGDLYRIGKVTVGSQKITTHHFDVDNGNAFGTTIGIGSVEFLEDDFNATLIASSFSPNLDAIYDLGTTANRWNEIYCENGVINTSDARLKDNIKPIHYGLTEVMNLKPVSYTWKNEHYGKTVVPENEKEVKLGFLAQDLQKIITEVVQTHNWVQDNEEDRDHFVKKENDKLGVVYSEIIPVLVKAIQEQQTQIEDLKTQVQTLKNSINTKK